ncbi:NAD(P)/FAD-dependent oxidoreductase [Sedimenticola hydrogenitrophicus]|uniref:NAD(P)/FAD-dependent oxidoreductase n=1 Tax=Sedimenticola hydrogenitrophicus TaxID=2967975 RepID=UPI0023AF58EC|nr:FAD-dependent monooxygenase [Sedimenticola hydrogenitrophicus]
MMSDTAIEIAGAGPAGLAAAITLARAGRPVIVHEAQAEVGYRFKRDLQGLENWTTRQDALAVLRELGVATDFKRLPCRQGTVFDAWGKAYAIYSHEPLFYMVERGPGPDTLDTALLRQAIGLGVEVRFNSRVQQVHGPAIFATGPKAADVIAVGYHFDTHMADGFWAICDDDLAPKGYAYLLVMGGKGTVKSCMFTGFKQEARYVQRTVEAFARLVGLEMIDPRPHGGVGNFRIPVTARSGAHAVVGEQAGFQDTLWGFGMRAAMTSGVLAACSLLEGSDYDRLWRQELGALMAAAMVNRALYGLLGNRGYRWLLHQQENRSDARELLHRYYCPSLVRRLLAPLARRRFRSQRKDESCNHVDCSCVWCRHGREWHA